MCTASWIVIWMMMPIKINPGGHVASAHAAVDSCEDLHARELCAAFDVSRYCSESKGLGRLVAFIFLLDGAVLGLPYIWRGFPFKAPKIIQENVEADVERDSRQPQMARVFVVRLRNWKWARIAAMRKRQKRCST